MKRYVLPSLLVFISLLSATEVARAQESIDVLVAFSTGVFSQGQDPTTYAGQLEVDMNTVMARSGMSSRSFRFRPYIIATTYPLGSSGTVSQALDFVVDETDPSLVNARETGALTVPVGVAAYDLVLMVVPALTGGYCGVATNIRSIVTGFSPLPPDLSNSRYGLVISNSPGCFPQRQALIAHGLGHIFGGQHQTAGECKKFCV